MSSAIISLTEWFQTPPGRYLLEWERTQFDQSVANLFGYNALQLGLPELPTLETNRMPHRWLALPEELVSLVPESSEKVLFGGARGGAGSPGSAQHGRAGLAARVALVTNAAALPFPEASLDLLVLPHTLELSADPHHVLREVERVLVPEGRVVISGFNPYSLWGLRQARARWASRIGLGGLGVSRLYLPEAGDFIATGRLKDWLRLLSFEVESERFGCYRPAVKTEKWLQRMAWMDRAGRRWWPVVGSVYFVVAVKRVRGMRLLGPAWKPRRSQAAVPASVTNRQ
ncbi:methyltransferase type 11 [Hydrogenophaga crassostreae]|uniref:Methyltransferase type 11 n=1 Tax=Hydrogenophaga crassostreae TaxID=1763535 RepID=A0A167IH50_9BURK|nr:methyltransferase domain-containing protein [Hydrogenophaga crassostreae]AOW13113.1 methyltransferase type 11 [Hydrogenophaga crassostreae]OAD42742.1 methyltransferase type 11 [Hydrogenophaga crassostreae]